MLFFLNFRVNSDEEMFPDGSVGLAFQISQPKLTELLFQQPQYGELKDLDSQTMQLFNSQTYADDANRILKLEDFAGASQEIELASSLKGFENLAPGESVELDVYASHIDPPTSTTLHHLKQFPSLEVMVQPWINFRVNLPSDASDKTSWMYSDKLQKLFVKMGNTCTFNVQLMASPEVTTVVRAMVVCSSPEDQHHPVSRCDNHRCSDNQDIPDDIKMHVIRCKNEQVSYVGTKDGKVFEERLAILVPMEHTNRAGITLEFVCQNSCRNINRRATALVFTLEDQTGRILGRQMFQIKICTNIKRDKLNEENAVKEEATSRKRKTERPYEVKKGKKLMRQSSLVQVKDEFGGPRRCEIDPVVVQVTLPNRRMAKRMLENAIGQVSTAIVRSSTDLERNQLMQYVHDIRRNKCKLEDDATEWDSE